MLELFGRTFILYPDEAKSQEIIGRKILREKLATKKSFIFEDDIIQAESQEYFAKANLLRELRMEQDIISRKVIAGRIKNYYMSDRL